MCNLREDNDKVFFKFGSKRYFFGFTFKKGESPVLLTGVLYYNNSGRLYPAEDEKVYISARFCRNNGEKTKMFCDVWSYPKRDSVKKVPIKIEGEDVINRVRRTEKYIEMLGGNVLLSNCFSCKKKDSQFCGVLL